MRYKLLGRSGLRVSELCLGTMTFGEDWGWGASREESAKIFDRFVEAGGNFIDTACNYTNGTSERYVGELVAPERERFVLATKYTLTARPDDPNGGGNHRKNMVQSLEASLKRLNTDYVDLFWLHMWDATTSVEEIMRAFDDLVRAGKVLYIGISDTPAWVVSQADTLAELRGWTGFAALQLPYSVASRDPERDLLPMARALGLSVTAWAVLGGGILTGKYNRETGEPRRYESASERSRRLAEVLSETAREIGCTPAQAAISWVRQQGRGEIIPILGARTEAQMVENLGALEVTLGPEQLDRLDAANDIELGFPHTFLDDEEVHELIFGKTLALIEGRRS
ncbi:MAG TPA: aldo/keto reductase [Chloroflexota bacterium]|nr:aldo/keto reductase [Chloroflexota bacterium]